MLRARRAEFRWLHFSSAVVHVSESVIHVGGSNRNRALFWDSSRLRITATPFGPSSGKQSGVRNGWIHSLGSFVFMYSFNTCFFGYLSDPFQNLFSTCYFVIHSPSATTRSCPYSSSSYFLTLWISISIVFHTQLSTSSQPLSYLIPNL